MRASERRDRKGADRLNERRGETEEREEMSKEEKNEVSESYKNVQQWLVDQRGTAFGFGDCIRSPCLIHDEDCLVQVAVKEEDDRSCLRLSWAGTTCIGWSSVGEAARYSHQSEMVHATWMAQRIRLSELALEDGFFPGLAC